MKSRVRSAVLARLLAAAVFSAGPAHAGFQLRDLPTNTDALTAIRANALGVAAGASAPSVPHLHIGAASHTRVIGVEFALEMVTAGPLRAFACALVLVSAAGFHAYAADITAMEAVGTQFEVKLTDGRVLQSFDLVGAEFTLFMGNELRRIRIVGVEHDPGDPRRDIAPRSQVVLHEMIVEQPDGTWQNLCAPGPDGVARAFPLRGELRPDGTLAPARDGGFEITCTAGAQGKCVRYGYWPWREGGDPAAALALFNACVRMMRADYLGDGRATTREGMRIDLFDTAGRRTGTAPDLPFEAGWDETGAVCVRHVRETRTVSLGLLDATAKLHGRTGDICTEDFARRHGAVILNRSPQP